MKRSRTPIIVGLVALCLVGVIGLGLIGGAGAASDADTTASLTASPPDDDGDDVTVSEEEYVEPAPEAGDPYYEASDGNWVSYLNPRDEYRSPYLGEGSGKVCVTLLNEAGDPIVGETVPNTQVTIPTGESLEWHPHADPMTVQFPMTDHYERPLDADQFGTTPDLPQGDGYMDSHCIEMHGQPEDVTIEYGEAQLEGDHAEDIEVVGYIQQAHDTWDTDIDPIEDAESYEEAGGGWTKHEGGSHGQVVVVLQLEGDEHTDGDQDGHNDGGESDQNNGSDGENGDADTGEPGDGNESDTTDGSENESESETSNGSDDDNDEMPGFGVPAVIVALGAVALFAARQSS